MRSECYLGTNPHNSSSKCPLKYDFSRRPLNFYRWCDPIWKSPPSHLVFHTFFSLLNAVTKGNFEHVLGVTRFLLHACSYIHTLGVTFIPLVKHLLFLLLLTNFSPACREVCNLFFSAIQNNFHSVKKMSLFIFPQFIFSVRFIRSDGIINWSQNQPK